MGAAMPYILELFHLYGYVILLAGVFLEAIGVPIPAIPLLVTAGAAIHYGEMPLVTSLVLACLAMLTGDFLLFLAGRHTGWFILGQLCRLSLSPETCILKSAESFYRRGRIALVFAKFIPGMSLMAIPLAGSLNMPLIQFIWLDLLGVSLYICGYISLGFYFSHLVSTIVTGIISLQRGFILILLLLFGIYLIYRFNRYLQFRHYRKGPAIPATELARQMAAPDWSEKQMLLDVRSHGYHDPKALRIKGSIRIEPSHIVQELPRLSKDIEFCLYCTCPQEATSARVAYVLRQHGFQCVVLEGGFEAWLKAGLATEPIPPGEILHLPHFS
jgi:membrane protein DedA with SNARE-associated domain/rhodanese-related sulfurtransferase